ncbi:NAD(P)/FAD-dependent oxidoreductase [Actinotalea soli]|uniref:NAD(P)/FAD-dependent oxidoreductase n=1 Tax=Actinotalea soli TaxID=2819234 RepID=UPI0027DDB8B1|nr:FAD-dependent oxidoreductase [Actinotalea soli]
MLTPGPVPRSVVVVGAGLAGSQTVAALRAQGFDGHVTVLGAEGLAPYDRPPLSKELLTRSEPAWLRDELGTDLDLADDVRLDEPATALDHDADGVTVQTSPGGSGDPREVRGDVVVLATGSGASRPWPEALTLHAAADAARLRESLVPGARLVVVGAGWIGAEVAGVAAAAGVEVTVVEGALAPLSTALGAEVGALTAAWYEPAGVRLLTSSTVAAVQADHVDLADGTRLEADVVLAAVGARPRSGWIGAALPLEADGSLAVDDRYRVLAPQGPLDRVLAVGDLARRRSARHGWVPGGHWDGALRGPAVAVRALLEPEAPVEDLAPYVFSTQLGHELACYGLPGAADEVVLRGAPAGAGDGFTALWFAPGTDRLTAVLAVDRPRDVAAARKLFAGPTLPTVDRPRAADPATPLRTALLP